MSARFIVADVFDGLATLEDGSVDLVITSPPFLALRSYLPADHELKGKEIGSEATPAEFIDTLLKVTAELRRVLAPHGSICVELGDTYAGSGGSGGDYAANGLREGQPKFRQGYFDPTRGRAPRATEDYAAGNVMSNSGGPGWPLAKSRTLIPSLCQIALAYGFNPLTGQPSPAGQWRIRNIVTWARPNPPVGALGDKWRPATSDLVIACTSGKRYWDDLATRKPHTRDPMLRGTTPGDVSPDPKRQQAGLSSGTWSNYGHSSGAPLLDYWVIPPGGYAGAHYAVFPEELVVPCVQAMCPQRVCVTCGQPSRRIVEVEGLRGYDFLANGKTNDRSTGLHGERTEMPQDIQRRTSGWTDCGCCGNGATEFNQCGDLKHWRPGLVLDPFAGSGTTLAVATGHGHDAIGIDIDARNAELARDRVGPFLFDEVTV